LPFSRAASSHRLPGVVERLHRRFVVASLFGLQATSPNSGMPLFRCPQRTRTPLAQLPNPRPLRCPSTQPTWQVPRPTTTRCDVASSGPAKAHSPRRCPASQLPAQPRTTPLPSPPYRHSTQRPRPSPSRRHRPLNAGPPQLHDTKSAEHCTLSRAFPQRGCRYSVPEPFYPAASFRAPSSSPLCAVPSTSLWLASSPHQCARSSLARGSRP
jgi:hypothetical protein